MKHQRLIPIAIGKDTQENTHKLKKVSSLKFKVSGFCPPCVIACVYAKGVGG